MQTTRMDPKMKREGIMDKEVPQEKATKRENWAEILCICENNEQNAQK